jgi:TPP-dependent 2-oxoacid decarboxylase
MPDAYVSFHGIIMADCSSGEFTMAVNEDAVVDFQRFFVSVIRHVFLILNIAYIHSSMAKRST